MKKVIVLLFCFVSIGIVGQENSSKKFGSVSKEELEMKIYEKDSSANAVVLYEKGHTYFNLSGKNKYTRDYYVRIKIFNKSAFDRATIKIPSYKSSRVKNIEAVVYNLTDSGEVKKTYLEEKDILKEKYNKSYNIKSFAIPNVKEGSVIEYRYTLSRNGYGIYDWSFQSDIPKVKSVYKADLSLKSNLQLRMIGFLKPSFEKSEVKKRCVGVYKCSALHYEMEYVPAFKEEVYLTSKYNYLSRLSFERKYYNAYIEKGKDVQWGALDKGFREIYKHRLNQSAYYRKNLPNFLFKEKDQLKKAKDIYTYIQKRFTKDNESNFRFDEVLEKKIATSIQINLALYNAFKAANLDARLMFLSTRKNGFVTKLHATVEDFNYIIVKLKVNNEEFLLDATDKMNPFGLLPFKCLNGEGRVLDFTKGSYWELIKPTIESGIITKVIFGFDEGELVGDMSLTYRGYDAKEKRDELEVTNNDDYIEDFESSYPDFEVETYSNKGLSSLDSLLTENFKVLIDLEDSKNIRINPFLINRLSTNPFKLNERKYPVDYGYKRSKRYVFSLEVPEGYSIKSLPKSKAIKLPYNGGKMMLSVMNNNNRITILYRFILTRNIFSSQEYQGLKEFYSQVVKTQDTFIELEKKQ